MLIQKLLARVKDEGETQTTRKIITAIMLALLSFTTLNTILTVQAKTYSFTAVMSPAEVNVNQFSTFSITITDTGDSSLGSASVAIPAGFSISPQVTIDTPATWTCNLSETAISLTADGGASALLQGESVVFTFSAVAPASPGVAVWAVAATSSINGGGISLAIDGAQPAVTVTSLSMVTPVISSSAGTINQGQVSLISQISGASGGTVPYNYQWLEAFDGEAFSPIPGATGLSYTFSTATMTAIGTWGFQLRVTDSSSIPVVATSNSATVIVNSALTAPTLTADPNPVQESQPSILTSSPVTTGTPPFNYQWFQKTPGGEYATAGSNSLNYDFPGSTITGENDDGQNCCI